MCNIKMYYHGGSKNHGCEAIVRATYKVLNTDLTLYSKDVNSDNMYRLDEIVHIKSDAENRNINIFKRFFSALYFKIYHNDYLSIKYFHNDFFNDVQRKDIYFSIGGDNYCYSGRDVLSYYNKIIHKKNGRTVLWGCSFEPNDMNDEIAKDIALYDAIFVRESLSYEVLKKVNNKTYLFPDPAFQLDSIELPLPDNFLEKNTVGINISPLIAKLETTKDIIKKNCIKLVEHIINKTNMNVVLIPHVVENDNNDLIILSELYDIFKETNRVCLIHDHNCMELKGFIARCRFFIGARTHSTIAAYSMCIPTLAIGYSIKAKGIAKDIFGTYENYVVPVQDLKFDDDLINCFQWLYNHENQIKNHLVNFMPDYKSKALLAEKKVKELII